MQNGGTTKANGFCPKRIYVSMVVILLVIFFIMASTLMEYVPFVKIISQPQPYISSGQAIIKTGDSLTDKKQNHIDQLIWNKSLDLMAPEQENTKSALSEQPVKPRIDIDMELALAGLEGLHGEHPHYLTNYKNPCWNNSTTIRCLPYFYQLGVGKSGTTTLYKQLIRHPDIFHNNIKELFYWSSVAQRKKFKNYVRMFDGAAKAIKKQVAKDGRHNGIIFEATPAYFTNQGELSSIENNYNSTTMEPIYTLAHTLYALNPETRLLVTVRNPTDRLFSHYHHFHAKGFSAKDFHEHAVAGVKMMETCLAKSTLRSCTFNYKLNQKIRQGGRIMLHYSMYYPYAVEWLSVFPRNQMKFIIAEDWYENSTTVLKDIFNFLGLTQPSGEFFQHTESSMEKYHQGHDTTFTSQRKRTYHSVMWPKTRVMLDKFFKPFNKMIAEFMRDDRFLFL